MSVWWGYESCPTASKIVCNFYREDNLLKNYSKNYIHYVLDTVDKETSGPKSEKYVHLSPCLPHPWTYYKIMNK